MRRFVLVLALFAVAVGTAARVAHLEHKLFWQDEAMTALRVSGHDIAHVARLYDGTVRPVTDVLRFVRRAPGSGVATVAATLARDDPHHAPLFYLADRAALEFAGAGSATSYRLPSVVFGILAIGFAFAFGRTLDRSSTSGAVLAALVALSPLHVLYSRQAREYALFTCLVFASGYALLRALDRNTPGAWGAYALAVALGMYTDPIFALVVAAQAVGAVLLAWQERRVQLTYAAAAATGLAAFVPWAGHALGARGNVAAQLEWGAHAYPLRYVAQKWAFNVGAVFFDAEFADLRAAVVLLAVLLIVLASFAWVIARGNVRVRALGLPLTVIPIATFVVLDAAQGAHFSTIARYVTAGLIGVELVVACALVAGIRAGSRVATGAFALLVAAGAASAIVDNLAENWWDNNENIDYGAVARRIDAAPHPLVILEPYYEVALLLAPYLKPETSVLLLRYDAALPPLPADRQIFAVVPSPHLVAALRARAARGSALTNVSPPPPTIIAGARAALRNGAPAGPSAQNNDTGNALWALLR